MEKVVSEFFVKCVILSDPRTSFPMRGSLRPQVPGHTSSAGLPARSLNEGDASQRPSGRRRHPLLSPGTKLVTGGLPEGKERDRSACPEGGGPGARVLFMASLPPGGTPRACGQVPAGLTRARKPRPVLAPGRACAGSHPKAGCSSQSFICVNAAHAAHRLPARELLCGAAAGLKLGGTNPRKPPQFGSHISELVFQ